MKGRARSIPAPASSDSCNWRRAIISRFASRRMRRNISICCAGRRCDIGGSRWSCLLRRACCGIRMRLRRLRILTQKQFLAGDSGHRSTRRQANSVLHRKNRTRTSRGTEEAGDMSTAIVFLEQLYPFPEAELAAVFERHRQRARHRLGAGRARQHGGAFLLLPRLRRICGDRPVLSVKRSASASPATGSAKAHEVEQKTLLTLAFTTQG